MASYLKKLWYCFRYESPEVTAWLKTASARGPETVVGSLFTSTALIYLAERLDDDDDDRVDVGLVTLKISSVLSAASVVENVTNAILSPYWGALADSTSHRKGLLVLSSAIWVGMVAAGAILLFFTPSLTLLWLFFFTVLFTIVFYELALLLVLAYLPEIVDDEDQLTALASRQYAIVNALQFFAAALLVGVTFVIPDDAFDNDLHLTVMAHFLVVIIWCYYAVPGLMNLPSRTAGKIAGKDGKRKGAFTELIATSKDIYNNYPNVGYFLLGFMFFFAGVASVTILQVAYVTEEFDYSTTEVSYLGAMVLVFSVIGSMLAEKLAKRFKLKTLLLVAILIWAVTCFAAPFLIVGEEAPFDNSTVNDDGEYEGKAKRRPTFFGQIFAFIFAIFVGMGVGFIYPVNTAIYSIIIPGGSEASYFGIKTFCSKAVSWAPPLVFTLINEQTDNLQVAFMSLGIWFTLSLPFIFRLNVEKGIRDVEHTLYLRQGGGKHEFKAEHQAMKAGMGELESVVSEAEIEAEKEEQEKRKSLHSRKSASENEIKDVAVVNKADDSEEEKNADVKAEAELGASENAEKPSI